MSLDEFREKVRTYRRPTGYSQEALAHQLGLYPTVLSHKLRGDPGFRLTHPEVKQLVKTLAQWGGISYRVQAEELLALMDLKPTSFTEQEWNSPPLSELEVEAVAPVKGKGSEKVKTGQPDVPGLYHQQVVPSGETSFPPVTSRLNRPYPPNNLPAQPTPLVGRVKEVKEVFNLLHRSDLRLLTLTGPGGVGKSRLALQVAFDILEDFEDGVFFVTLASVTDARQVAAKLAQALGIKEVRNTSLETTLKNWLKSRQLLLVLDNFEHLLPAGGMVLELLQIAPRLKILVTSRVLLHIYGEHDYKVPPLSLPNSRSLNSAQLSLSQLQGYDAISFFIQRAHMVNSNFNLNDENAAAVAQICHRLDGLPLALELAAARLKIFTPQDLLARLNGVMGQSPLQLLTGGPKEHPNAHQTLRSTIDWSYQALSDEEKKLFARLTVFTGCWRLEAAESICAQASVTNEAGGNAVAENPTSVLEGISSLLDKSMIFKAEEPLLTENTPQTSLRFDMLETLREYALERLAGSGELTLFKQRHAGWFLDVVKAAEQNLKGPQQAEWLSQLDVDQANIQAAINWTLMTGDAETAAQLCCGLQRYWEVRGFLSEGLAGLERVLELNSLPSSGLKAKTYNAAGDLAQLAGKLDKAINYYRQALKLWQECGDKLGAALALNGLGNIATDKGDYPLARQHFEESLRLRRESGDRWAIATSLNNLGHILSDIGEAETALQYNQECLAILREIGDKRYIAMSLTNLGLITTQLGNYPAAWRYFQEGLLIKQEIGDKASIASSLNNLSQLACYQDDYQQALHYVREAEVLYRETENQRGLTISLYKAGEINLALKNYQAAWQAFEKSLLLARELQSKTHISICLTGLAELATARGTSQATKVEKTFYLEKAALLYGAVEKLFNELKAGLDKLEQEVYNQSVEITSQALGKEIYQKLWNEGYSSDLEEIITSALVMAGLEKFKISD